MPETEQSTCGNASQFFVNGELYRMGYSDVVALGNTTNTDISCSNLEGTRFARSQVNAFVPESEMSMKNKPRLEDVAMAVVEAKNLSELGSGGFKIVYKAEIGGAVEALKVVRIPDDAGDPSVREDNLKRIDREIRLLRSCVSPELVKLGSLQPRDQLIGQENFLIYSEELLPGSSLRESLRTGPRPPIDELVQLATCLLRAIAELVTKSMIHRDIKPDNVMRTGRPERPFVLLDLGIAFHVGGTPITRDSRAVIGTLHYIAPEMLDSAFRQNLDYRADLYSMGLTIYEYASGINPFAGRAEPERTTFYRIKNVTPEPLSALRADLPSGFCELVDQLIRKLPALRPSRIPALLKRLEVI
jgi:serine/threonine-protein kinase